MQLSNEGGLTVVPRSYVVWQLLQYGSNLPLFAQKIGNLESAIIFKVKVFFFGETWASRGHRTRKPSMPGCEKPVFQLVYFI